MREGIVPAAAAAAARSSRPRSTLGLIRAAAYEMASFTRTETVTPAVIHILPAAEASESAAHSAAVSEPLKQVSWEEGTLDNENMGKKSSKVCCIYHKPRAFAESSSESSSSSNSDSSDGEGAKKAGSRQRKSRKCSSKHKPKKGEGQKPCPRGPPDEEEAADKAPASPEKS
ncbi:hypothetical protein Esti_004647 [Eimeria stiedai]